MNKTFWAKTALLSAALIWGISFVVLKNAISYLPPLITIGVRFSLAFLLLSLIFHKKFKLINKDYIIHGIIAGCLLGFAYSVQTVGLSGTTPGKNAFLTAGYCIITPFLYWVIDKKRPTLCNIAAAVVCMTGFGLICLEDNLTICKGDILTIICGFFYAAHICAVAKLYNNKDSLLFSIIQFGAAAILNLTLGFIFEGLPASVPLSVVPNILFLSFGATALGLTLQNIGQKYAPPAAAAILLSMESVFGVLFSLIFYADERLTLRLFAGFALTFFAVIISEVIGGKINGNKTSNT